MINSSRFLKFFLTRGLDFQLCLAMAALAVQMTSEEWGRAGVIHWLGQELGSQPEAIPVLLELLAVFPQVSFTFVNILFWLNDIWTIV